MAFVTPIVAILTLTARTAAAAPPPPEAFAAIDRVLLPVAPAAVSLRVDAVNRSIVVDAPRDAAEVARAIRRSARTICLAVDAEPAAVRLTCRTTHLVARVVGREGGSLLDVRETRALPWGGLTAPLAALDPPEVGLGTGCPGSTPEGRAECRLAQGDAAGARTALSGLEEHGDAALRLGDLALESWDVAGATAHWGRAQGQPWQRLAAARTCELDPACAGTPRAEVLYGVEGLPPSAARELFVRHARALALSGRAVEGARLLLAGAEGRARCAAAPELCRRVALAALREPGPGRLEALALWVTLPARDRTLYDLEVATARAAASAGAPVFAANVLAGSVGRAPPSALPGHLLETAELYVAGGDRVRAGVVHEFARARVGARGLAGARWAAVSAFVRPPRRGARRGGSAPATGEEAALLAAADRAIARARALTEGGRP